MADGEAEQAGKEWGRAANESTRGRKGFPSPRGRGEKARSAPCASCQYGPHACCIILSFAVPPQTTIRLSSINCRPQQRQQNGCSGSLRSLMMTYLHGLSLALRNNNQQQPTTTNCYYHCCRNMLRMCYSGGSSYLPVCLSVV